MRKLITPLFIMLLALTGCDNNDLLQSEDKVKNQVNAKWQLLSAGSTVPYKSEVWNFDNGSLTISRTYARANASDTTYVDHGTYTILTKFSKSFVTISGLTSEMFLYWDVNTRWNIAEVNSKSMYLSTTDSKGSIISREFVKN